MVQVKKGDRWDTSKTSARILVDARKVIAWAGCKRRFSGSLYFSDLHANKSAKQGSQDELTFQIK